MPDENELLEHTEDAGDKAISRLEEAMASLTDTVGTLAKHTLALTDHVASLEVQQAAEEVPAMAREGVEGTLDTAGNVAGVGTKAIDVPLAVAEDTVHDTAATAKAVKEVPAKLKKEAVY